MPRSFRTVSSNMDAGRLFFLFLAVFVFGASSDEADVDPCDMACDCAMPLCDTEAGEELVYPPEIPGKCGCNCPYCEQQTLTTLWCRIACRCFTPTCGPDQELVYPPEIPGECGCNCPSCQTKPKATKTPKCNNACKCALPKCEAGEKLIYPPKIPGKCDCNCPKCEKGSATDVEN
ncbi:hypothetical protein L596_018876 [Steinernema carpocapsae]|uniref:Antistasin-like domain-containing protein n=1 Tax=Steinernema carpocapsae TaxID=34508 RepID=A0A4U5N5Y5_STECR|nr:hypothetical protein L596_018876 [Steinernema carpocapsae]